MSWLISGLFTLLSSLVFADPVIIPHDQLRSYPNNGNSLTGIATTPLGATESEVWQASIAVDSETPLHTHAAEEIVILQAGDIEATVDGSSSICSAPCTIILPANKQHKLKNVGPIPTNHILVMPARSKVYDENKQEMFLPWRQEQNNSTSKQD